MGFVLFVLFRDSHFSRYTEGRIVVDPVYFFAHADRNVISLSFLQSADGIRCVVGAQHNFCLRAYHVFSVTILKNVTVATGGLIIFDRYLTGFCVLRRADHDRLEAVHELGV